MVSRIRQSVGHADTGTIVGAVNGAAVATVNLIGSPWVLGWEPEAVALVNLCVGAWITVAHVVVRSFRRP